MADDKLTAQDMEDLEAIHKSLPSGDPRIAKIMALKQAYNAQPTQFEQERNPASQKGFLSNAADTLSGIFHPSSVQPSGYPSLQYNGPGKGFTDNSELDPKQIAAEQAAQADKTRQQSGRSGVYRVGAALATPFADVQGMEHNADIGNTRGILGNAAGSAVPALAVPAIHAIGEIPTPTTDGLWRGIDRVALGDATPQRILTKALKPPVTMPQFEDATAARLPEIANAASGPIKSVNDFAAASDAARDMRDTQYQHLISPFRPPTMEINGQTTRVPGPFNPITVDTNPVADAQIHSIPVTDLIERPNRQVTRTVPTTVKGTIEGSPTTQTFGKQVTEGDPGIFQRTIDKAAPYRTNMPLGMADAVRVDTNAKLRGFYNKASGDQFAALSDPETARVKAVNDTTRDLVYNKLNDLTGVDPRPIQNAFGDLSDISDVANKRGIVYGRQNPFPLQEQINSADALAHGSPVKFGLSKLFSRYGNADSLTGIAMDRFQQTSPSLSPTISNPTTARPLGLSLALPKKRNPDEDPE